MDSTAACPNRYREGSASGLLPIGTKQEIFVASTLREEWITLFKQYVAAAEKAGDPVHLLTMDGAGYFDGINPQAPAWQAVMASIRSLVRSDATSVVCAARFLLNRRHSRHLS
jgi:hypothetical protein